MMSISVNLSGDKLGFVYFFLIGPNNDRKLRPLIVYHRRYQNQYTIDRLMLFMNLGPVLNITEIRQYVKYF